jgi:hypothetical protein
MKDIQRAGAGEKEAAERNAWARGDFGEGAGLTPSGLGASLMRPLLGPCASSGWFDFDQGESDARQLLASSSTSRIQAGGLARA